MKKCIKFMFATVICSAIMISCEKESVDPVENNSTTISKEVSSKLLTLNFNPNVVTKQVIQDIDGSEQEVYFVEKDIVMTYDQIMNMEIGDGVDSKQYRTFNLVSTPRTIRVVGYNGNDRFGLSTIAQRGLNYAVNNFNALNVDFQIELVFTTNFNNNDVVAYTQTSNSVIPQDGVRGRAGFPSGGEPFKRVMINGGANRNNNDQLLEGLFTHELGHCFGLRHVDWFSRESCGESGEPANPDGAIHIPGTPTGRDRSSIMNACFNSNDGEFGQFDRVALEYLY
ncbi:M57 family metalloprotease [Aquimarina sp. 2201CG14-23]|uniref:M57 family metalloprotease n=1 Tax=Aquimarina mycalae TaxID=3040073 RepID=UPI00247802D0|nr:M57 family metalloprotease [Aquimarina sp. 2201CG14-23]MDH7444641.1 M57 family metalloprotease [Aquimarina sp. 2201CG14-23]